MRRVFGLALGAPPASAPQWTPFAFYEGEHCVASVETALLRMVLDGVERKPTALRRVATDPAWRGQGLFRDLMQHALVWCTTVSDDPCLLYTADQDIYARFGFAPLAQHAFVGIVGPVAAAGGVRTLDMARRDDRMLVETLLATRTPVSERCAMLAPALFMDHVIAADDLALTCDADRGLLVVSEVEDDGGLTLVDIVAAQIPPLDVVLATAGGCLAGRLKTLFPPDRLGWDGSPIPEDTGLMIRGEPPAAMTRPFMLPPTTEF